MVQHMLLVMPLVRVRLQDMKSRTFFNPTSYSRFRFK
uniref:Uncharacterized protein n=1 Tax=Ciona intestinalis TaxID=7719 RepID=H2XRV5_CIOIN